MPAVSKRPDGRPPALTLTRVVEAARDLIRQHGLESLTMRAVADRLGVTTMATYHHVEGKDELVRLVVDSVRADAAPLVLDQTGWEAGLRRYLLTTWRTFQEYPGLGEYETTHFDQVEGQARADAGIAFFEAAGFTKSDAALAFSFAQTYLHGRLGIEAIIHSRALRSRRQGLRAHDYVEFAVEGVIVGIRAMTATSSPAASTGVAPA